jgi:hypothetical protein
MGHSHIAKWHKSIGAPYGAPGRKPRLQQTCEETCFCLCHMTRHDSECCVSCMSAYLATGLRFSWRTDQSFSPSYQSQRKPLGHFLLLQAEWVYSDYNCNTVAHNVPFYQNPIGIYCTCAPGQVRILRSSFAAGFCCPLLVRTRRSVSQPHTFSSRHTEWFYCNAVTGIL